MPSATYTLFRNAILGEQQVVCIYDGRVRELCPHIIGTSRSGEEVVLAWQFGGESSGPLPQWRCLKLSNVSNARARGPLARRRLASDDADLRQRYRSRHQRSRPQAAVTGRLALVTWCWLFGAGQADVRADRGLFDTRPCTDDLDKILRRHALRQDHLHVAPQFLLGRRQP